MARRSRADRGSAVAKVLVYELAKEFGVESKAVMDKLKEMGEFVRSASSTIEAPVVRRLKESFATTAGHDQKATQDQKASAQDNQAARPRPAGRNGAGTPAGIAQRNGASQGNGQSVAAESGATPSSRVAPDGAS